MIAPLWDPAPGHVWLNTASYGLPPRPAWEALQEALEQWRGGASSWVPWGERTHDARLAWARLVGVRGEDVAVGASVAEMVGLVAASLPPGARVIAGDIDFTSLLWPFMARGDLDVELMPAAELPGAVDSRTYLAATSAVGSADGALGPLDELADACERHGARTLIDATQATGWLHLDAARFDFFVGSAYKWLMSPRGTAFLAVAPERLAELPVLHANWFAGESIHDSYFGGPLRLAADARRLDTSPAWASWIGTAAALEVIEDLGVAAIGAHALGLADAFRAGLGLEPYPSPIVSVELPGGAAKLAAAGIHASERAGMLRVSFHCHNGPRDVELALAALA